MYNHWIDTAINYIDSNTDDDRFQKLIIVSYSDTQSNTDHCIYADDLLRKNIETFVINAGNNVDANALEYLTNDKPENVQTTRAIDAEDLNHVVYAILPDICGSSERVTDKPSDLPTVSPTRSPSDILTDAASQTPTFSPTGTTVLPQVHEHQHQLEFKQIHQQYSNRCAIWYT